MDWLNANASAIQAVSAVISVMVTIVLVVITRKYVEETKKYRVEAEKSRKVAEDTLRVLENEQQSVHEPCVIVQRWINHQVKIANLGRGPALNIAVKLSYHSDRGEYVFLEGRHYGLASDDKAVILLNRSPNPPDSTSLQGLYNGDFIAKVEVHAQNIVTGERKCSYSEDAFEIDRGWDGK